MLPGAGRCREEAPGRPGAGNVSCGMGQGVGTAQGSRGCSAPRPGCHRAEQGDPSGQSLLFLRFRRKDWGTSHPRARIPGCSPGGIGESCAVSTGSTNSNGFVSAGFFLTCSDREHPARIQSSLGDLSSDNVPAQTDTNVF